MANTFDPDKYLSEKESSPEFNPDVYLSEKEPQEAPSQIESALRGAGQGASFGTIDELLGAIGGGEGSLTGAGKEILSKFGADYEGDADVAAYKEARDLERAKNKAAEEENPGTYMLGELGAGLATIPLGGGLLKGAGLAAKAAPAVTKSSSAISQLLAKSPMLSKIGEGITTGAKFGAAQGLGESESDTAFGTLGDITKGSVMGGAIGGALGTVGAVAGKVADSVSNSKVGKRLGTVAESVAKGEDTRPTALTAKVNELTDDLVSALGENKANKSKIYDAIGTGAIDTTNLPEIIKGLETKISLVGDESLQGKEIRGIINDIEQSFGKKRLVEKQIGTKMEKVPVQTSGQEEAQQKLLTKLAKERAVLETNYQDIYNDISLPESVKNKELDALQEQLSQIDKFTSASSPLETNKDIMLARLSQNTPITDLETGVVQGVKRGKVLTEPIIPKTSYIDNEVPVMGKVPELGKTDLDVKETLELKKLLNEIRKSDTTSYSTKEELGNLVDNLISGIEKKNPGSAEAIKAADTGYASAMNTYRELGIKIPEAGKLDAVTKDREAFEKVRSTLMNYNPEDIGSNAVSRVEGALNELKKSDPDTAHELSNRIMDLARKLDLSGAVTAESLNKGIVSPQAIYLQGARVGLEATKAISDTTKALYQSSPEALQALGNKIGGTVGATLQKISEAAPSTRNALLFTALQRPGFREALRGSEEEQP